MLQKVNEKVKMYLRFTISSLSEEFPQVSHSVLYEIVSKHVAVTITSGGKFLWQRYKKPCFFDMISALILEEIMWKARLKCGVLCKNKTVTMFLLVFYTPKRYLLKKNTPHIYIIGWEPTVEIWRLIFINLNLVLRKPIFPQLQT